jgi:hypothetical protein
LNEDEDEEELKPDEEEHEAVTAMTCPAGGKVALKSLLKISEATPAVKTRSIGVRRPVQNGATTRSRTQSPPEHSRANSAGDVIGVGSSQAARTATQMSGAVPSLPGNFPI